MEWNESSAIERKLMLSCLCPIVLQIRQEKPYYIADPEVDSLVSKLELN